MFSSLFDAIRVSGISDTAAGRSCGISPSTFSRCKKEIPHFADFLEQARAQFELSEFCRIERRLRRQKQPDVRVIQKLLERAAASRAAEARKPPGRAAQAASGADQLS